MTDTRIRREEKLKQKREIDLLFLKGKWQTCDNLRLITIDLEKRPQEDFNLVSSRFGVSVSKKFFKRAVYRNRIKRLLRECYRLNKDLFYDRFGEKSISMLFWVSRDLPASYQTVEENFLRLCELKKKNTEV